MGLGLKTYLKKQIKKIKDIYYKAPLTCQFEKNTKIINSKFEGANIVNFNTEIIDSTLGYATVVGPNSKMENCEVGRYCSIAPKFNTVIGHHPTNKFVSTCNLFYTTMKPRGFTYVKSNKFVEYRMADIEKQKSVVIGNDVWLGDSVSIIEGVKIGDGAIIGAGAIVTKDIPPYAIAVGVPARVIKYRFPQQDIDFLLELKWWDKGEGWIERYAELFEDIEKLKEVLK